MAGFDKREVAREVFKLYGMNPPPEATRFMDRIGLDAGQYWDANRDRVERGIDMSNNKNDPRVDAAFAELQQVVFGAPPKKGSVRALGIDPRMVEYMNKMYSPMLMVDVAETEEQKRAKEAAVNAQMLLEAKKALDEMNQILENIKKEALVLYKIDRMTKDKKFAFVKKGDMDLRVEAVKDLEQGDEVLLHPKTFQIVERLGKPPLEVSQFAPAEVPNVHWDDIGGLEEAKYDLIEAIEMPHTHKELYAHYDKKMIKGILLSGPPGCGKTMLGKAAAASLARIYGRESCRTGFLYVKGPEILNQYVGQTEQTIRDMFDDARRHQKEKGYPAIIFLDEADAILATRGTRNVGIGNTIVPMFLTEMDGLEESGAIVIIATNRPDVLDPAVVRDGRVDRKIVVTRPEKENGKAILQMNLRKTKIHGIDIAVLAEEMATIMYSDDRKIIGDRLLRDIVNGAMLANAVQMAVSFAIQRDIREKTMTGLTVEDAKLAIARIEKQSSHIQHDMEDAERPNIIAMVPVPVPVSEGATAPEPAQTKKRTIN